MKRIFKSLPRLAAIFGISVMVVLVSVSSAFAWSGNFECLSNDAKKAKLTVAFLDSDVVRTSEVPVAPERYYRVTDSAEELLEAAILGHKSGEAGRIVPVPNGTMSLTMTKLDENTITASVQVGKKARTFSCSVRK